MTKRFPPNVNGFKASDGTVLRKLYALAVLRALDARERNEVLAALEVA